MTAVMRRQSIISILSLLLAACASQAAPTVTATPLVTPTPTLQMRTFEALWTAVNDNYVYADFEGADWEALHAEYAARLAAGLSADEFAQAMRAMLAALPPGTAGLETREERIEREIEDASSYEGIGAYVAVRPAPEPRVVLLSVMPGSPAQEAGLAAHDSILAIDGAAVTAEEGPAVIRRVRGPADSQVTLQVRSPGKAPRQVIVTRRRLVAADLLKAGVIRQGNIGYFLFPPAAYEELVNEFGSGLQQMSEGGALGGVILDLRIATSGGGWPLTTLLSLFADGELGETYTRAEVEALAITGQDFLNSQTLPMAVIVGPDTQGLPEIFAAAMQAAGRATIVGMPTPGEVERLTEYPLPDGSRAFIATSSFRTPDGREIGLSGVTPDVKAEADWDAVTTEDDPVRDAAVAALQANR